jgi:RNA binding exosome subunit
MNKIELLSKLRKELLKVDGVIDVKTAEGYYPNLDAYLEITLEEVNWKIAKKVADKIAKVQTEYLEKEGILPAVEWDFVRETYCISVS